MVALLQTPPLNSRQLELLYGEIRWEELSQQGTLPAIYGGFHREHLLKTQLLPYLLPLSSERRLANELAEREFLGS